MIADEVPQHSDDEPLKLRRNRDCKIPKKTTHAYQPANQFIITTVKARVCRGWDAWVEDIFARNSNDRAIAKMSVYGATHMGFLLLCVASWQGRMTSPLLRHQNITKKKSPKMGTFC